MGRVAGGVAFALLLGIGPIAHADDALSLERQADAAVEAKQFDDAAAAYEAAWVLAKKTDLLPKLARAYEAGHRYAEALDRLATFAAAGGDLSDLDERLARLRERVAVVVVRSTVCDAEVRIRGAVVGKTCGSSFKVNAGVARIDVTKPGHAPFVKTMELSPERTTTIAAPLDALDQSVLVVNSSVAGARVAIDGEEAGTAPTEVIVRPGLHAVVVSRDGYETRHVKAIVGTGQRSDVRIHLEEEKHVLDRWWFWTAVGIGVGTAVAATVVLVSGGRDESSGTIAPGHVSSALRF